MIGVATHPLASALLLAGGLALVTALAARRSRLADAMEDPRCRRLAKRGLLAGSALVLGLYLAVVVWYVALPGFAGEVEPLIASVSWAVQNGAPLYHDAGAAEHYSVLYGPTVFLTNGWFLRLLGPSVPAAKAAGGLAAMLGLAFLYLALRPARSRRLALVLTAAAALLYWCEGPFSYNSRPDPFLLAAVSFGLLCAVRARPALAIAGVAAAIGFGANLKIHSGLFFVPVLVLLGQRLGPRTALVAAAGGLGLTAAPFLLHPAISARNYFSWLLQAAQHGLDGTTFLRTFQLTLYLASPAAIALFPSFRAGDALRRRRSYVAALVAVTGLVLLPASKPGAGLVHPMPLVPLAIFLAGDLVAECRRRAGCWRVALASGRLGAVTGLALAILLVGTVTEYRCVRRVGHENEHAAGVSSDIQRILAAYPGQTIAMACGGEGSSFRDTYQRPLLAFAGQPLLLDPIAVMESEFADRPLPDSTLQAVGEGRIGIWLVPRGREPFRKRNWYPDHEPIFSDEFVRLFRRHHRLRDRSEFFDLWFHDGVPAAMGAQLAAAASAPSGTAGGAFAPPSRRLNELLGPPCPAGDHPVPAAGSPPHGHRGHRAR